MDSHMFDPLVKLAWIGMGAIVFTIGFGIYKLITLFI